MAEVIELDLDRMAHGGVAMGRHAGQAVFVPYALPGEHVRARIIERKGRSARAVLVEIVRPSPARESPRCEHIAAGAGGPDPWQMIEYTMQMIYKREVLADQLRRVGEIKDPVVHSVLPNPEPWEGRMQMSFAIMRDGRPGYWTDDHKKVVPAEGCHALHPALHDMFGLFDLDSPAIRRVRFVVGSDPEDRMIILETKEENAPEIEVDLPVSVNLLLPDNEPVNLIGSAHVRYEVLDRTFRVTAGSYFHPHLSLVPALVQEVIQRLDLHGEESVLELYSGVGLLTAFVAQGADLVVSVESYPPAVTDAEDNTADLDNVDLVEGTVEDVLDDIEGQFDRVVVDPTPAGLSAEAADLLGQHGAPRIVYVSYDPASLGRDAKRLAHFGYRLVDVQPLDMAPQSFYIAGVATLDRK